VIGAYSLRLLLAREPNLASEASDAYVKVSLTELATEFRQRAEAVEQLDDKQDQPNP
jgi:hypothetical protein